MNRIDLTKSGTEAKIRYDHADFQVLTSGSFVRCAVTDQIIPIEELKYWSVQRQEPYVDAAASLARERQVTGES